LGVVAGTFLIGPIGGLPLVSAGFMWDSVEVLVEDIDPDQKSSGEGRTPQGGGPSPAEGGDLPEAG
jgi:hypothetical protein